MLWMQHVYVHSAGNEYRAVPISQAVQTGDELHQAGRHLPQDGGVGGLPWKPGPELQSLRQGEDDHPATAGEGRADM